MGHSIMTKKTDNLQFSYVLLGGGRGVYREKKAGIGLSIRFSGGGGGAGEEVGREKGKGKNDKIC